MKSNRISVRVGAEEAELLQKARAKLARDGKKQTITKTVRAGLEKIAAMPDDRPVLFFIDRVNIKRIDENIAKGLELIQVVLDEFKAVAGVPVELTELRKLYGTGRSSWMVANHIAIQELVESKLFNIQQKKYPDLLIHKDNLKLPDLTQLFDKAQNLMSVPMVAYKDVFFWQCYEIIDGKAEVIPEEVEAVKDQFRASAITPEERHRLGIIMDLVTALDKFLDFKSVNPEKLTIPGVVIYDAEANRFAPGERFVKGYNL